MSTGPSSGHATHGRRWRRHGQSLTEFALVAPVFFLLVLSAVNGGLFLYSKNAVDHSADVGMTSLAALGNCTSGAACPSSDADQVALQRMRDSGLGSNGLVTVNEVDITLETQQPGGALRTAAAGDAHASECTAFPCTNRYTLGGASIGTRAWLPSGRVTAQPNVDFARLDLKYTYRFFGTSSPSFTVDAVKVFRLEPQT